MTRPVAMHRPVPRRRLGDRSGRRSDVAASMLVMCAVLIGCRGDGESAGGARGDAGDHARGSSPAGTPVGPPAAAPPGASKGGSPGGRRLILIGLDAADERLISSGIASGSLPSFARMMREGVSGPLRTHRPILSPIIWTSMATGLTPDRHGVLDFIEQDSGGRTVPVTARSRRAPAFWNILGERGISCGIVGWLATWPAEPINGFIVSDRFTIHPFEEVAKGEAARNRGAPEGEGSAGAPAGGGASGDRVMKGASGMKDTGKTSPPGLYGSLKSVEVAPSAISDEELLKTFGAPVVAAGEDRAERRELRVIEAVERTYAGAALQLDRERRPDLLAVYFEAIDRLMHLFASAMPPPLPGTPSTRASRYGGAVERFYAAMDARLGQFLEQAGSDATVLVVSDHGFKIGAERPRHPALRSDVFAAEWHRNPGVILAWGRGVRRGARIKGADIYDITPTLLAFFGVPASEEMRGRVLADLFEPGFLPSVPARVASYKPATDSRKTAGSAGVAGGDASKSGEETEILENLRALGYVGGSVDAGSRSSSNLATFYLDEGKYDRAIEIYNRVLAKDPGDLTALYNLGYAYKGLGAPAKAVECFTRLLKARPDYTEARLVLSDCYVSMGRVNDGLALLKERETEGRSDPAFQNHLGTVLASAGRLDEAQSAFERAIALRPGEPSPYLNLARVLRARGDRAGATAALRRAEKAVPGDARISAGLKELAVAPAARR